ESVTPTLLALVVGTSAVVPLALPSVGAPVIGAVMPGVVAAVAPVPAPLSPHAVASAIDPSTAKFVRRIASTPAAIICASHEQIQGRLRARQRAGSRATSVAAPRPNADRGPRMKGLISGSRSG